ncbi:Uma2 family endonuclease [Streptomyces boncukensis]|uniref:Uma2 family endonuclease n=1 Tax=Streptomyces boncukensis TaxID=2711219 RepID=A0A6G4X7L0_9ACTN|nr:Uma2 family endonuclease [Streptomyces boncukensis]NGO72651.1 Uma2 family endonuclease [Streptomyces boncukensis]
MSVEPEYEWPVPPVGGYTPEDLDRLPNLPPHTELIDGSLVFVSPQAYFHMLAINLLMRHLTQQAPSSLLVMREMTVTMDRGNRPEPDLMLVKEEALTSMTQTTYGPEDVVLVIEVVSPDSVFRDRGTKPCKYAAAGIPHFWRVENEDDKAVVYVFELEPATKTYVPTGIHYDQLKLLKPFPVDIDLGEITLRHRP